jgi:hypothetical protein
MKISFTFLILFFTVGHCLSQKVNKIYLHGRGLMDGEEILFITVFEENNLYQNYQWNITKHEIGPPDEGEYFMANDTITCQPSDVSQKSVEYVVLRHDGKNILRLISRVYNPDGSVSDILMGSRPREELGRELYQQWQRDIGRN